MRTSLLSSVFLAAGALAQWETVYTATQTSVIAKEAATATTESPTSHVKGKAFDRIVFLWLENTDYEDAAADPNFQWLAKQGILYTSHYAVTHPSEPNYVAAVGGDYFGMDNDNFNRIAKNVSTVVDLLEDKGISWSEYQEGLPFSGYEGFNYLNQQTGQNNYVRKHNPLVIYDSVASNPDRLAKVKNLTEFYSDLAANTLPQWLFITPNMLNDGHDTTTAYTSNWTRTFVEPLLSNKNFMNNTVLFLTFDENASYPKRNRIFSVALGDAVPASLVGTTDDNFYNHYSELATVEANWGLHHLGRWDAGANVYKFVADVTGDVLEDWTLMGRPDPLEGYYFNTSYAGPFNADGNPAATHVYPAPNLHMAEHKHNRTILPAIFDAWKDSDLSHYYVDDVKVDDGLNPPAGYDAA